MIGVVSGKSNDFQKRSNIWKRNATLEYDESGEFLPARSGCALLNCCTHQACFAATPGKYMMEPTGHSYMYIRIRAVALCPLSVYRHMPLRRKCFPVRNDHTIYIKRVTKTLQ